MKHCPECLQLSGKKTIISDNHHLVCARFKKVFERLKWTQKVLKTRFDNPKSEVKEKDKIQIASMEQHAMDYLGYIKNYPGMDLGYDPFLIII